MGGIAVAGDDIISGSGGGITVLSAADGSERWHWQSPDGAERDAGPPAVSGCTVAVVAANASGASGQVAGTVRVLSLDRHTVLTTHQVDAISAGGLLSAGGAFTMVAGEAVAGGVRWMLLRVQPDGSVARAPAVGGFAPGPPAGLGPLTLVEAWDGALTAFGSNGQVVWRAPLGALPLTAPAAWPDRILVGTATAVVAVDPRSGRVQWSAPIEGGVAAPPLLLGQVVVAVARDGTLRGVDARTGEMRWRADAGGVTAPAVGVGGLAVVAAEDGTLTLLDPHDGRAVASLRLPAPVRRPLAVADGRLYALGEDGSVTAVDLAKA